MFRKAAGAILAATCLTMALAPAATAASDPVVVMIEKNAQLAGGQILVSLRARCEARLSAFARRVRATGDGGRIDDDRPGWRCDL